MSYKLKDGSLQRNGNWLDCPYRPFEASGEGVLCGNHCPHFETGETKLDWCRVHKMPLKACTEASGTKLGHDGLEKISRFAILTCSGLEVRRELSDD